MSTRRLILQDLLTLLLLVPSIMLYHVVSSESGLQWLARHLNRTIGPVTLVVEGVSGTLLEGFHVERVHVQHRRAEVEVHDASGTIDFMPLLAQRIQLHRVAVGRADVTVLRNARPEIHREPHFMPRLLQLVVEDLVVREGSLALPSGRRYEARNVRAAGRVLPQQIRVRQATLELPELFLQAQGAVRVRAAPVIKLDGAADIDYLPHDLPPWRMRASVNGDIEVLPVQFGISAPFHARASGEAIDLTHGWQYNGKAEVSQVDITDFGGGGALGLIAGQLDIHLDEDGYKATGKLTPAGLAAGAFDVKFDGQYHERRLQIRSAEALHPPSGAHATVRGAIRLMEQGGPELELEGRWRRFRWPLATAEPTVTSEDGRYRLHGQAPWQLQGEGNLATAGLPAMPFTLQGRLSGDHLDIDEARVQLLSGEAQLAGLAEWGTQERWRIEGRASGIDPASVRADLPGRLDFGFAASGAPFGSEAALAVDLRNLSGTLRGVPARGSGHIERLAGAEEYWHFRNVDLRLGQALLQLDGELGDTRNLTFALDADDLALLDPGARGRLSARGRLAGTPQAPLLLFKARGTGFAWGTVALDSLDADVDLDLGANGHTAGQIQLDGLAFGVRKVEHASVSLSGAPQAQRIVAYLEAAPLHAGLTAQGTFDDGHWQGWLQTLRVDDIDPTRDAQLTLASPARLAFSLDTLDLAQACLQGAEAQLCLAGRRRPSDWRATFTGSHLPLRTMTAGLVQDMDYEGQINFTAELTALAGRAPNGRFEGELTDAELVQHLGGGRIERTALGSGRVEAFAGNNGFEASVGLDAGEAGYLRGRLMGTRPGDRWQDYPINGQLELATNGLGLLESHVGEIDRATGRLRGNLRVTGALGAPTFNGQLELRDTAIDVYQVNLSLREMDLDAQLQANTLRLDGQARIGEGHARVSGSLQWRDREPHGDLHVEGDNLLLVDVPEARIHASSQLDFKLSGRHIDARGTVKIPEARLVPADLTNAVLSSGDEVLVGAAPVDPMQRWVVTSDIRLELGDAVDIDALGLTAKLGGGIQLRLDESGITRGQGELVVTSGRYAALGRLLDISRGRLLFNNGPLGDPAIDLRAQKEYPDIIAGVNVRGTLRAPRMTFFSEPAIPQSQIASLILAGGSLESVQNSNQAGAARNDLLAQGGAILAQQFGARLGIEDVSIESDLSNETSLVLGKYLSPRLYVSYGISLAEAINTLKLRYTISNNWTFKTEAGKAHSADVVFTLER